MASERVAELAKRARELSLDELKELRAELDELVLDEVDRRLIAAGLMLDRPRRKMTAEEIERFRALSCVEAD